jgi:Tol biopolymer transport system component
MDGGDQMKTKTWINNKSPHEDPVTRTSMEYSPASTKRAGRKIVWTLGIGFVCVTLMGLLRTVDALKGSPGDLDENPAWSPDGSHIAFESDRDGNRDVYVMNADGSEIIQLTKSPYSLLWSLIGIDTLGDGQPDWSADGSRIVFISGRNNGLMTRVDYDIFTMDQDGSNIVNLTRAHGNTEMRPAWSPDGTRIMFESIGMGRKWDIYVMNADGSGVTSLSQGELDEGEAAWSPDGSHIAYISNHHGNFDIYTMVSDGSSIQRLTDQPSSEEQPVWSPDGSRIAFTSNRDGNWDIYIMNADGSEIEKLTSDLSTESQPSWSPDGKHIAFTSDRNGDRDIYVMNTDGSKVVQLTGK